ncbi:MAG: cytochrome c [Vicinamibacterales bacterium]
MRVMVAVMVIGMVSMAPVAARAQDAAKGEAIYGAQKCQMCHSVAGKGGKTSALDGVGKKLTAAEIKEWIVDPAAAATKHKSIKKPLMPKTYAKLPAADIDGLVAYLQTLK